MKKKFIIMSLLLGLGFNMSAVATEVACVDVQKVVTASPAVQNLKKEQETKAKEILSFVEKARKDVAATKDEKKKIALEEKYNKELLSKKEKMDTEYASKLRGIEDSISQVIATQAKTLGYDMVIAKSTVLYGGNDITDEVIKAEIQSQTKTQTKTKAKTKTKTKTKTKSTKKR